MANVTESLSPGVVAITGIAIVFLVLVFLVLVISIFGAIGRKTGKKNDKKAVKSQPKAAAKPTTQVKNVVPVAAAPVPGKMVKTPVIMEIEDGITGDVVAAIAAAVATVSEGRNVSIRSIRRDKSARPAWASAGVMENTRPF